MTITLTRDHIRAVAPANPRPDVVVAALLPVLARHGIDANPERLGMFLAQWAHESNFISQSENLNYSAQRLREVWPGRFPTLASALPYAHNPRLLANRVYNGRMGNRAKGDDGWLYRGQGWPQLTGRDNFRTYGPRVGQDLEGHPELIMLPAVSAAVCGVFWADRNLNRLADAGDMSGITRSINGGQNGLADRLLRYRRVVPMLRAQEAILPAPPIINVTFPPAADPKTLYLYSRNREADGRLREDWTSIAVDAQGRVLLGDDGLPRTVYMTADAARIKGLVK